jgi:hypothetical protein
VRSRRSLHRAARQVDPGPGARRVDPEYPYGCAENYCGSYATRIIILTDEERAEHKIMMIYVGRSLTERLVFDS